MIKGRKPFVTSSFLTSVGLLVLFLKAAFMLLDGYLSLLFLEVFQELYFSRPMLIVS